MNKLFKFDNKLTRLIGKLADLMLLQLLTLLCCLPIITIGASLTAMHKILLQLRRNEEGSIAKDFFRAFRSNLRQGILIWIFYILLFLFLFLDQTLLSSVSSNLPLQALHYLLTIIVVLSLMSLNWAFVILSRYQNSLWGTLRSAFLVGIAHPLHSLAMTALMLLPWGALLLSYRTVPFVVLLGLTLPGYLQAIIYSRIFDKLENS